MRGIIFRILAGDTAALAIARLSSLEALAVALLAV